MSNSPVKRGLLPLIPDEIIYEIFSRTNSKMVGRCRTTSTYWRRALSTREFILKHSNHSNKKGGSILAHLTVKGSRSSGGWVIQFDAESGKREAIRIPFWQANGGQFHVIGCQNGNIAIRYSCKGKPTNIIVLKPQMGTFCRIPDPVKYHCSICGVSYAFTYLPNSFDYVLVRIFKKKILDTNSWFSLYSSVTRRWDRTCICPPYVQGLDPRYVVSNGIIYWLNWNNYGVTKNQCIIHYSVLNHEFGYILIPLEARCRFQRLLVSNGSLYYVANYNQTYEYRWLMWNIVENAGSYSWHYCMEGQSVGFSETPQLFNGDELILLKEINITMKTPNDGRSSWMTFTAVGQRSSCRRHVYTMEHPSSIFVKSLNFNYDMLFPV